MKKRILTGDRPTGPLHLGHYVGSLENRIKLQDKYDCFFIIADFQVLTDHLNQTKKIGQHIQEIVIDYLSIGIDPKKSTIFIQSQIPEISELTMYFSMMVSLARVKRNPTVKEEMKVSGQSDISYGFVGYPISQAADILCVRADLVPVGEDQVAHVEQTREIARTFNRLFKEIFPVPKALVGRMARLPGFDGQKMSKSRNNAIYLSDSVYEVKKKINSAITDRTRIHPTDKGHPDICNIFQYYKAFDPNNYKEIEKSCREGEIGCVACKKKITSAICNFLKPIQEKRERYKKDKNYVREVLNCGNKRTREEAKRTLELVKEAIHFDYAELLKKK